MWPHRLANIGLIALAITVGVLTVLALHKQ
jgi:hypothetical protein